MHTCIRWVRQHRKFQLSHEAFPRSEALWETVKVKVVNWVTTTINICIFFKLTELDLEWAWFFFLFAKTQSKNLNIARSHQPVMTASFEIVFKFQFRANLHVIECSFLTVFIVIFAYFLLTFLEKFRIVQGTYHTRDMTSRGHIGQGHIARQPLTYRGGGGGVVPESSFSSIKL